VIGDESIFDARRYGPEWHHAFKGIESPPLSGLAVDRDVAARGTLVYDPARVAARTLRKALERAGVAVARTHVAVGHAPAEAAVMAQVLSPPLWRILRFMDRESDNFTAEMVLKSIGAYAGAGGTTAAGLAAARGVVDPMLGDDAPGIRLVDGSGLSYSDRVSADAITRLLVASADDPSIGAQLERALSVAGINGTLAHRMRIAGVRGRVHAKTGTLDDASALSGYATTRSGGRVAFSILINGRPVDAWRAHDAQDAIASLLARSG
jgi:PBP4 family serine-type D-alanyl-D-alanine carboxypeptidase